MNPIPTDEGSLLGFLLFVAVAGAFVAYKKRDAIKAWLEKRKQK